MIEEVVRYLEKVRDLLKNARIAFGAGLNNDAGRDACLAVFHAAQALIFHYRGKAAKTHQGVQTVISQLALEYPEIDKEFPIFLSQAYNLKSVADYETGPDAVIPVGRVERAIESAEGFVKSISFLLGSDAGR